MHSRTVILAVDDHPNYFGYLSYTQKAWNVFGWDTLTFYLGNNQLEESLANRIVRLERNAKYRECSVVQVSRLLCGHFCEGLLMLGDADMIPLSNYWNPTEDVITCYRHYNSSGAQISMCYVAAHSKVWKRMVPEMTIEALLQSNEDVRSRDFNRWWFTDQRILTSRIVGKEKYVDVFRESSAAGRAFGRIDRADWANTFNATGPKIDAHMPHPFDKIEAEKIMRLVDADGK
jgi:hypothetical protein